jgi:transcriptional regulator with GAF, ATPase, and Fis domain
MMIDGREEWLARTFIELADTLVADFDVIDLMCTLVDRCAELLDPSEVGLALADASGQMRVLASSTERMRVLELIEVQSDEGPCRDCFRSGAPVVNQRLDAADDLWPTFAVRARSAGFQMVHALPLRLRDETIGAMNIFNANLAELTLQEVNLAQALADAATIGLLQQRAVMHGVELATQLQGALNSRIVVEQAKGIVAERRQMGMDQAFDLIRGYSRENRKKLSEVAVAVISGTLTARDLSEGQPRLSKATSQERGGGRQSNR